MFPFGGQGNIDKGFTVQETRKYRNEIGLVVVPTETVLLHGHGLLFYFLNLETPQIVTKISSTVAINNNTSTYLIIKKGKNLIILVVSDTMIPEVPKIWASD